MVFDKSNSSAENTLNTVADQSEAEIGNYFGNLSNIAANRAVSAETPSPAKSCTESLTDGSESNGSVPGLVKHEAVSDIEVFIDVAADKPLDVSGQNETNSAGNPVVNAAISQETPSLTEYCLESLTDGSESNGCGRSVKKHDVKGDIDMFIDAEAQKPSNVSAQIGASAAEKSAENAMLPAAMAENDGEYLVAPKLSSERIAMASGTDKDLVNHENDAFIHHKTSSSAASASQNEPMYDAKFLEEAREASKRIWDSLVAKTTIRGTKRDRPDEPLAANGTDMKHLRPLDPLEACMFDMKALSIDPNHSKHVPSVLSLGTLDDQPDLEVAPVSSTSPTVMPLMVEVGQAAGPLCGMVPTTDKLCAEPARSQACKPSPAVIGCEVNGSTNREEA